MYNSRGVAASLMTILASLLLSHGMRGGFRLQAPGECGVSCLICTNRATAVFYERREGSFWYDILVAKELKLF